MEKKKQQEQSSTKKESNSQGRSGVNDFAKYAGMGIQMLAIIAIFTWAGIKLDARSGNEKSIYTAILSLLGVVVGIYTILKDFIRKDNDT